jgi:hypothetical protein
MNMSNVGNYKFNDLLMFIKNGFTQNGWDGVDWIHLAQVKD